jgi:hypothetical protein
MESFYQKGDSTIQLPLKNRVGSSNGQYRFVSILDTLIMKNGYTFNYRIIAKDKGIIPETANSPDSGYYKCDWDGETGLDNENETQFAFKLDQNYPNPFNPSTVINYQLPVSSLVSLKVYDVLGNEVAILVNEEKTAGLYNVQFTMNNVQLSSGIYFYQLKAGAFVQSKKMVLLR